MKPVTPYILTHNTVCPNVTDIQGIESLQHSRMVRGTTTDVCLWKYEININIFLTQNIDNKFNQK